MKLYSLSEVIGDIEVLVNTFSTQKKTAEFLGISPQYLTDILKGRRLPGAKVLRALGFEEVKAYKYIGKKYSAKETMKRMPIINDIAIHDAIDNIQDL